MDDLVMRLREAVEMMRRGVHSPGHITAVNEAADRLEATPWISVKDRLPEKLKWVLVCGEYGMDVCYLNIMNVWIDADIAPEYWMPLPEPPEVCRRSE